MDLTTEVTKTAKELREYVAENSGRGTLTAYQAFKIAAMIQRNRLYKEANVLDTGKPSALEAIAMELGASKDGYTIKSVLAEINQTLEG